MNQILVVFLLASSFAKTNGLTTQTLSIFDRFCASEARSSGLLGCVCSVYRTQLTPIVDRYNIEVNNAISLVSRTRPFGPAELNNILRSIQRFLANEIPRDLEAICPSANAFQTCLEANFTDSQTPFDRQLQAVFNRNITRLLTDICELERSADCVGNITMPAGFCVSFSFVQRSMQSQGVPTTIPAQRNGVGDVIFPSAQEFCPSANDVGPCVAIQAAQVCNRQLEEFIKYFGSRYFTTSCTNLRSQGLRPFNSVFLQCQLVTGSNVIQAIAPLITEQSDIPSIIARAVPPFCARLQRDIACVNEYLGQSTNRVDMIVREIIDIQAFTQQSGRFISSLCNQTTISNLIQVIQCLINREDVQTQLATCGRQDLGLFANISFLESLPLDGASIRSQLCSPITRIINCGVDGLSECNANFGATTKEILQLLLRDDCLAPGTGNGGGSGGGSSGASGRDNGGVSVHLSGHIITFLGVITMLFYRMP